MCLWLATACRRSYAPDSITYCTPRLDVSAGGKRIDAQFVQVQLSEEEKHSGAVCWLTMFRNPVIATGYPVCARNEEQVGLELPLQMMAALGRATWATIYYGSMVLKGFRSMFVPVARHSTSIIWHFLLGVSGKRMSYNEAAKHCKDPLGIDYGCLEQVRHFVGWTSDVTSLIGK